MTAALNKPMSHKLPNFPPTPSAFAGNVMSVCHAIYRREQNHKSDFAETVTAATEEEGIK